MIGIESFECSACDTLELAGTDGRHFYAVGTGLTWREALGRAYKVACAVSFPNKIFKVNLFGYSSPSICDSNLDFLLPKMIQKGIIPLNYPK